MKVREVVITRKDEVGLQDGEINGEDLKADEVLIETESTFISAGTELANYTGREPKVWIPGSWCAYPWKSGYANVGTVRACGSSVSQVVPGQRVFSFTRHGSMVIEDLSSMMVIPVPAELDSGLAAASRMAGVSLSSLIVAELVGDPWVVVYGLGMVGNTAAQAFAIRGCRVIGVDPVEKRRQLARECGIERTIGGDPESVLSEIRKITGGRMGDIVVESVGPSAVVREALKATATLGQLILLGTPRAPMQTDLSEFLSDVHLRGIVIRGALEWRLPMYDPLHARTFSQFSKQEMIFSWLLEGKLKIEPMISHRLRPEDIKEAYEGLLHDSGQYTGVVLDWTRPGGN